MTLYVNLFGGPGTGKSTHAALIFALLKLRGVRAELVTEYAKDLTWEGNHHSLAWQPYVTGRQLYKQYRCDGQVDVIVTDSPFLLGAIYPGKERAREAFVNWVVEEHEAIPDRLDVFLERVRQYDPVGRNQTEEEAREIDKKIRLLLDSAGLPYCTINANGHLTAHIIVEMVLNRLRVAK